MSLVLERLDESLVVMTHYLGWSLADAVVVMAKKALSSHPTTAEWPIEGIKLVDKVLSKFGENAVYNAAVKKLDQRITQLSRDGVNVTAEVEELRRLRSLAVEVCLQPQVLSVYRAFLNSKSYLSHSDAIKFRDVDSSLVASGNAFSLCGETFYSFDICGSCEAHAQLHFGKSLFNVSFQERKDNVNFKNCPNL